MEEEGEEDESHADAIEVEEGRPVGTGRGRGPCRHTRAKGDQCEQLPMKRPEGG